MAHRAQVIHHIPGRVRIKMRSAKGNHALMRQITESLSPQLGIRRVETNAMTGSVLIHYDPNVYHEYETHLAAHGESENLFALKPPELTEVDEMVHRIEDEAEFLAQHSETARVIVDLVKQLNASVKRSTNNMFDLNVLLPLAVAAFSMSEIGIHTATPLWVTLGIFSFNSFVNLHRPCPHPRTETHQVVVDDEDAPQSQPRTTRRGGAKKQQGAKRRARK